MLIFWHWWGISSARKRKSSTYAANNIFSHRGSSIQWPQFPPTTMTGSSATMPSVGGVTEGDTNWRTTYDKLNTTIAFVCLLLLYIRYLNLFNLRNGVPRGQLKAPHFWLLQVYDAWLSLSFNMCDIYFYPTIHSLCLVNQLNREWWATLSAPVHKPNRLRWVIHATTHTVTPTFIYGTSKEPTTTVDKYPETGITNGR